MSAENHMFPGFVPNRLPILDQIEQMLISRIHVSIQIQSVRGAQFRYTGHVINFLRDVGKIYNKLPLLPEDLEIIILRPSNTDENPGLRRQFAKDYRVRWSAITVWLEYLKENHPGYADIVIDRANLAQLPEGESVMDQIASHELPAEEAANSDELPPEELPEVAAVPNLLAEHDELERLRQQAGIDTHLTQPGFRATPLTEFCYASFSLDSEPSRA